MDEAPGLWAILGHWRFDPVWSFVLLGCVVLYAIGFARASKKGSPHPAWRLGCVLAAAAVVFVAVSSSISHYGREVLWVDFTGFLLLTMVAPPLFLLGAPLTLAFRVGDKAARRRLRRIYRGRVATVLTFPIGTWLLFAIATYLWQFTDLTEVAVRHEPVRYLQQFSLLLVGLLFWMPAIAADPMRWRMPYPLRTLYIFVEMTHKGLFGGMFLSMTSVMHRDFAARAPSWAPDPLTDQRLSILILWLGGNLVFIAALVGLVLGWVAYERRNQHRTDWHLRLQNEAKAKRRAALEKVFTKSI
jgi:putative copper resistance protein D